MPKLCNRVLCSCPATSPFLPFLWCGLYRYILSRMRLGEKGGTHKGIMKYLHLNDYLHIQDLETIK